MQECVLAWWQQEWFITSIPFIFGAIGWFFKVWWDSKKPYKKDQETFENIKNVLDNEPNYFIENMKWFAVGNSISQEMINKLHKLRDVIFKKPEMVFLNKKVMKKFRRLVKNTTLYSDAFIDSYEPNGDHFVMYKPYNHRWDNEQSRINAEALFHIRYEKLVNAQNRFINSYDDFIKISTQELYKERIN